MNNMGNRTMLSFDDIYNKICTSTSADKINQMLLDNKVYNRIQSILEEKRDMKQIYLLARCYYRGLDVPENKALSNDYMIKSHEMGCVLAMCHLSYTCMLSKKYDESFVYLTKGLETKCTIELATVMFYLAMHYDRISNFQKACECLHKSVILLSSPTALIMAGLAKLYIKNSNKKEALYWYNMAYNSCDEEDNGTKNLCKTKILELLKDLSFDIYQEYCLFKEENKILKKTVSSLNELNEELSDKLNYRPGGEGYKETERHFMGLIDSFT